MRRIVCSTQHVPIPFPGVSVFWLQILSNKNRCMYADPSFFFRNKLLYGKLLRSRQVVRRNVELNEDIKSCQSGQVDLRCIGSKINVELIFGSDPPKHILRALRHRTMVLVYGTDNKYTRLARP